MGLRAAKHSFTGETTPIGSYDYAKTNLGTLIFQNTGSNPEDKYVGPLQVGISRPMQEVVHTGNVSTVSATVVTGSGTTFTASMTGMAIGFGSTNPAKVTTWYTLGAFTSATIIAITSGPTISTTTPFVIVSNFPGMYPHALTYSPTIDWVFMIENLATSSTARRIFMYEFNKTTSAYSWKGFINTTLLSGANANTIRGFRALRYLHTTGTASASATAVTGSGTFWQTERLASGARIGFGSTDPTEISTWYVISSIDSETGITLSSSAGSVVDGPYVIEELRFAITTTQTTTITNGGLFLVKGINYSDFLVTGTTIPVATTVDNTKAVYWLSDAGTAGNIVTNVASCGLTLQSEINKGLHYAYVPDGVGSAYMKVYRYNLRATGAIASGKMTMSMAYYNTNTVSVSGTAVTGSVTNFTTSMIGMKIGFGSKSPALITTWYTISAFSSSTSITLSSSAGTIAGGTNYVIDSADVITTGNALVAGTVVAVNNGRIGTLNHGPGAGVESLYFVTSTRIYRAALSNIYSGNLNWISDNRPEIPPGSVNTFPLTNALNAVEIADQIDRLIVLTTGATAFRQYVTRYPEVAGDQFDHVWGVDDKQQDQSTADQNIAIHFNSASQVTSGWSENGIFHIIKHGASAALCQMYALPFGAHWNFAESTSQQVITPSILTPDCSSYKRLLTSAVDHVGGLEFRTPTASIIPFYRTNGIEDNTGEWTLVSKDGDLSGLSPSTSIQFMFRFTTISALGIPGRILSTAVLYDDFSTDPHFQPSVGKTNLENKEFAWRFSTAFGTTVPTLRVRIYDAVTTGLILNDTTTNSVGTWEKSIDGGSNWISYDDTDKTNEITYIRYTPPTLPDNTKVRSLLTLY